MITLETDLEQFVVIAAFRYTLGRRSYAVSIITQWLIKNWDNIGVNDQNLIRREIQDALDHDCAGMEMDKQRWRQVLACGEKHTKDIGNTKKENMIFTPIRHVDGE
jgi:hypothetical protein